MAHPHPHTRPSPRRYHHHLHWHPRAHPLILILVVFVLGTMMPSVAPVRAFEFEWPSTSYQCAVSFVFCDQLVGRRE
jgi:hypothetical protein